MSIHNLIIQSHCWCIFYIKPNLQPFFQAIVGGFLGEFPQAVKEAAGSIVGAAIEIYGRMSTDLLPTPTKSHYVFNLRDLSKCVQGVMRADPGVIREQVRRKTSDLAHECSFA